MIAADTTRSRAYIQAMVRNSLSPSFVLVLASKDKTILPGQILKKDFKKKDIINASSIDEVTENNFNILESLIETLDKNCIKYLKLKSFDIHNTEIIQAISSRPEPTFIYSGYGGVILQNKLFETGKKFLHVHGGYLPDYKGSTTNYYSLISENIVGASSLILNSEIDSGPIILRKKFSPPKTRKHIDHIYDNAVRAQVLIETLKLYEDSKNLRGITGLGKGETYFIIHPILKHIAILSDT